MKYLDKYKDKNISENVKEYLIYTTEDIKFIEKYLKSRHYKDIEINQHNHGLTITYKFEGFEKDNDIECDIKCHLEIYVEGLIELMLYLCISSIRHKHTEEVLMHTYSFEIIDAPFSVDEISKIPENLDIDNTDDDIKTDIIKSISNIKKILLSKEERLKYWSDRIEKDPRIYDQLVKADLKNKDFENKFKHLGTQYGFFENINSEKDTIIYDDEDRKLLVKKLEETGQYQVLGSAIDSNSKSSLWQGYMMWIHCKRLEDELILDFICNSSYREYPLFAGTNLKTHKHAMLLEVKSGDAKVHYKYNFNLFENQDGWYTLDDIVEFITSPYLNTIDYKRYKILPEQIHLSRQTKGWKDPKWIEFWYEKFKKNPEGYVTMKRIGVEFKPLDSKLKFLGVEYGFFDD